MKIWSNLEQNLPFYYPLGNFIFKNRNLQHDPKLRKNLFPMTN